MSNILLSVLEDILLNFYNVGCPLLQKDSPHRNGWCLFHLGGNPGHILLQRLLALKGSLNMLCISFVQLKLVLFSFDD